MFTFIVGHKFSPRAACSALLPHVRPSCHLLGLRAIRSRSLGIYVQPSGSSARPVCHMFGLRATSSVFVACIHVYRGIYVQLPDRLLGLVATCSIFAPYVQCSMFSPRTRTACSVYVPLVRPLYHTSTVFRRHSASSPCHICSAFGQLVRCLCLRFNLRATCSTPILYVHVRRGNTCSGNSIPPSMCHTLGRRGICSGHMFNLVQHSRSQQHMFSSNLFRYARLPFPNYKMAYIRVLQVFWTCSRSDIGLSAHTTRVLPATSYYIQVSRPQVCLYAHYLFVVACGRCDGLVYATQPCSRSQHSMLFGCIQSHTHVHVHSSSHLPVALTRGVLCACCSAMQ